MPTFSINRLVVVSPASRRARRIDFHPQATERAGDAIHHFRQFNWRTDKPTPAARPTAGSHKTWRIRGPAHHAELGRAVGTSASGVAAMFGILRGWEIKATGHPIGHALQLVLPRTPEHIQGVVMLAREVWWPAVSLDP